MTEAILQALRLVSTEIFEDDFDGIQTIEFSEDRDSLTHEWLVVFNRTHHRFAEVFAPGH